MGGDEAEDQGQTSTIEELGSVGDWRLPSWMPRISGVAWLFIVIVILAVLEHLPVLVPRSGPGASLDLGALVGALAISLPILFPAAVLWHIGGRRPHLTGRLALGSFAIGIAAFFDSVVSSPTSTLYPRLGGSGYAWDDYGGSEELMIWIAAAILAIAGPVLLGNAIRGLRVGPASRQAVRAGIAIGGLAIAYFAFEATFPTTLLYRFLTPDYPGGLDLFGVAATYPSLWTFSFVGWAYFAWAVISISGVGMRSRRVWRISLVAVLIQQGLIALLLVAVVVTLIASPSGDPNPISDLGAGVVRAVTAATPLLTVGAWVLLLAAFAAGVGNPDALKPDAEHIELDPLPSAG